MILTDREINQRPRFAVARARRAVAALVLLASSVACRLGTAPTPDPTLAALASEVARQGTHIAYLSTQVGALRRPPTQPGTGPTAYPSVTGSVLLEEGRCCVGGLAGSTIEIEADFQAFSPAAEVTEMRLLARGMPANLSDFDNVPWEGFQPSRTFLTVAAINWVGFYVSVQYRDALGNQSPVYVDDISIEGMVPPPT